MPSRSPAAPGTSMAPSVLLILGSCVSLQFGAALASQLFGPVGSWGVTGLRLGIAAIVLLIAVRPSVRGFSGAQWRAILMFGVAIGAMNGCFYASIARIPLGTAVTIEFLGPLVLSAVLSRRAADLACVGLALAGVSLFGVESLAGAADLDPIGVAFALGAGVCWAGYILTSARVGTLVPGHGGLALALVVGSLLLMPLGLPGVITAVQDPHLLLLAIGTALLASVIPYSLELTALRRLPRQVFGILLSLEPVIAALAGVALLGQGLTLLGLIAVFLVVSASIGTTLTARGGGVSGGVAGDDDTGDAAGADEVAAADESRAAGVRRPAPGADEPVCELPVLPS